MDGGKLTATSLHPYADVLKAMLRGRDPITRYHLAGARHNAAFQSEFRSEFTQATYLARLECRRNEAWMPIATTTLSVLFVEDGHIKTKPVDLAAERGQIIEYMTHSINSQRSVFPVDGNSVVQFRNVYYHINRYFAISDIGDVYIWEDYQSVHSVPAVRLGGVAVRSVAMGNESYVLFVTHTGRVFSWAEETALKRIHIEGEARSASCSEHHSLVVTEGGTVYTFGIQHGLGRYITPESPEKIVMPLRGLHIASTAAGSNHSLAVTRDGDVLSWGHDLGQLGRPRKGRRILDHDHHIRFIPFHGQVRSVAACDHTSCAVTTDGKLFVWGKTQTRTGGTAHFTRVPLRVDALRHHVVDLVSIEFGHVVVLTRDGRVIGMDLTSALSPNMRIKKYKTLAL